MIIRIVTVVRYLKTKLGGDTLQNCRSVPREFKKGSTTTPIIDHKKLFNGK